MTIICYRDGVIAADTAVFQNDIIAGHKRKIARRHDGTLAGVCGSSEAERFCALFLQDEHESFLPNVAEDDDFAAFIVRPHDVVRCLNRRGAICSKIEAPFYCIGSCEEFALGVMAAGASAAEAVNLCIEHCVWAAGGVQVECVGIASHPLAKHIREVESA